MPYELTAGDTGSAITATLKDSNGAPLDLTGMTASFIFAINGQPSVTKSATVLNAAAGTVQYAWQSVDLTPGRLIGRFKMVDSGQGLSVSSRPFGITVTKGF